MTTKEAKKTTKAKPKFRKKDLISLVWPTNICYSTLIAGVPKGVTIDTVAGTWTFQKQTYQIGGTRRYPCAAITGDPIGVYDRTKITHLEQMKRDVEWVESRFEPPGD